MANDFGLLLKAVAIERPARDDVVSVAAEWMPHQWEIEAALGLRLPDVSQLVDEIALPV